MALRVLSRLGMAVADDLIAEIDDDLRQLADDLEKCRMRGESEAAEQLRRWIDVRLDERISLTAMEPGCGRHRRPTASETPDPQPGRPPPCPRR